MAANTIITISYSVTAAKKREFDTMIRDLATRINNGQQAVRFSVYHNEDAPGNYIEMYECDSVAEYDALEDSLDGIEVVKRLKADGDLPFIPVLLLTAKSGVKDVVQGLQAGADDREARELLRCLAVAGFAAANVMLLSVSVWSGAGSTFTETSSSTASVPHEPASSLERS